MAELIACQCRRGTPTCKRPATQEDFRCDVCRGGCTQLGWGPAGTAPEELEMTSHWETPETTWGSEIDSAPPAIPGHAGTPPNPPSTRTSPHMSDTDHTRNPRNENN